MREFLRLLFHRFTADKAVLHAASLTYTTLLALVPLMTVSVAILAAFPIGDTINEQIQDFVFENFVPAAGEAIQGYMAEFSGKAAKLTGPSFVFLVVTSLLLMASIDGAFNDIWRVQRARRPLTKFLVYWAVVTVGPLLMGLSVVLTSYLLSLPLLAGADALVDTSRLLRLAPWLASTLAFTLIYALVPMRRVPLRHALVGGLTAALLFELAKRGFGTYLAYFPTYERIYGALATVPIFLVWIFLSWLVTLFGAEITYCLSACRTRGGGHRPPVQRLVDAFSVLQVLWRRHQAGRTIALERLSAEAGVAAEDVELLLDDFARRRWVVAADDGCWLVSRDLGTLRLADLYNGAEFSLPQRSQLEGLERREAAALAVRLADAGEELAKIMDVPLTELFRVNTGL